MTCILQCYVTTWRKAGYLGNNGTLGAKRQKVESNSATSFLSDLREVITSVCSSLKMDFLGEFWIWNKMMEVSMLCDCTTAHMWRDDQHHHHLHSAHRFQHHQDYHASAISHVLSSKLDGESLIVRDPSLPIPSTRLATQLASSDVLNPPINSEGNKWREAGCILTRMPFRDPVVLVPLSEKEQVESKDIFSQTHPCLKRKVMNIFATVPDCTRILPVQYPGIIS